MEFAKLDNIEDVKMTVDTDSDALIGNEEAALVNENAVSLAIWEETAEVAPGFPVPLFALPDEYAVLEIACIDDDEDPRRSFL